MTMTNNVKIDTILHQVISEIKNSTKGFEIYTDYYGQVIFIEKPRPKKITIVTDGCGNISIHAA